MKKLSKPKKIVLLIIGMLFLSMLCFYFAIVSFQVACSDGGGATIANAHGIKGDEKSPVLLSNRTKRIQGEYPEYARPEQNSFMTFPEWYIVYASEEYATYIQRNRPSTFPYMQSIGQYWKSYCAVNAYTQEFYGQPYDNHLMLVVIGISFTIENATKAMYEKAIGAFFESTTNEITEEMKSAQKIYKDYGSFLHTTPFYEYPYKSKLGEYWKTTSFSWKTAARSLERRIIFTNEFIAKQLFASLISTGVKLTYAPIDLRTFFFANAEFDANQYETITAYEINGEEQLLSTERYEPFTKTMLSLDSDKLTIHEIAGNDEIGVSVLLTNEVNDFEDEVTTVLELPSLIDSEQKRILFSVPVHHLLQFIDTMKSQGNTIEHLYDY